MTTNTRLLAGIILTLILISTQAHAQSGYVIVDTDQGACYNNGSSITPPAQGQAFYGQDAQHAGNQPSYTDNNDGTISDNVTGLMWVKARGQKMSWEDAQAGAATCSVGGYTDWRMPTIKELYSLIDFTGKSGQTAGQSTPYINTAYFDFQYGNTAIGERVIDCQDWSATTYVHLTMMGDTTAFGVNFADGRIKGYPKPGRPSGRKQLYVRYVRGNAGYGANSFVHNNDSTITDQATGLMWSQPDSRAGMNWQEALAWVQTKNSQNWLGYNDWRLPNAKELQSIVDYTRSPATTSSAAIDPVFRVSSIGFNEYPFYWTSTTHLDNMGGVYISFGRGLGWMQFPPNFQWGLYDVHGAGCQRSDPKAGDASQYPYGHGPQGDVVRIDNYVRLVREDGLIPVEMSSFEAELLADSRTVLLHWRTESETNNYGFTIERRTDGAAEWSAVEGAFIPGHGTTTAAQEYAYTDALPFPGAWLYRLKQTDHDGTFAYSPVVRVQSAGAAQASGVSLKCYPNPVPASVAQSAIMYSLPDAGRARLTVYDSNGREVAAIVDAEKSAGTHVAVFTPGALPGGTYYLALASPTGTTVQKFVLVR